MGFISFEWERVVVAAASSKASCSCEWVWGRCSRTVENEFGTFLP